MQTFEAHVFAAAHASMERRFEAHGLAATVTPFESALDAVQGVQSGRIDLATVEHASALQSLGTAAPLVTVAVNAATLSDDLACRPAIKTADQVKGRKIATSTFGGRDHAAALLVLKQLKLQPADATIVEVGGTSSRIAAVRSGAMDCAVVPTHRQSELVGLGLNIVTSLWKDPVQAFPRTETLVAKSFLASHPNTVLVALAAVLDGQNRIWGDPGKAATNFASWAKIDPAEAKGLVDEFLAVGNRSLMWTDEAVTNAQEAIAATNPAIRSFKAADAFDRSFLDRLVQIGFYTKIGNPATTP
jgi:ABC-type nitrate/sulfonate/bicarbonate transport system substrate-binding protein